MLLAKSLCVLMKVVSHLSHTKPSLMCQLLTFLSAQLQNMAVWYGGTCKLRRWREYIILWILQIHGNNSQPGMLWYYVGQSSFIDTTESFHGEAHLWVTIALLWSSSHSLRIEIPSIIRGWELPSLATAATEFLHTHKYYVIPHPKTPVHWAMVHIRISLSKCYTHILRKVIRQWWASIISTRKLQVW